LGCFTLQTNLSVYKHEMPSSRKSLSYMSKYVGSKKGLIRMLTHFKRLFCTLSLVFLSLSLSFSLFLSFSLKYLFKSTLYEFFSVGWLVVEAHRSTRRDPVFTFSKSFHALLVAFNNIQVVFDITCMLLWTMTHFLTENTK
jgi:hypothetical protein